MKILITGINGFIGRHLSRKLIERGYKVQGLENKNEGVLNKKLVEEAIRDIDIVVHLAALTSHKDLVDNRFEALETSFLGTKNVLDAFIKSKSSKKFIYASTGKVYGKIIRLPIDENHLTNPLNTLGKSKLITEKLIDFYNDNQKEFVIFRAFQVYGPGQRENFLIPTIVSQVHSGKHEITLGDIKARRDYVFIDDLINGFVKVIERKTTKGLSVYNICSGAGKSAQDIVRLIEKIKGKKIKIKVNRNLLRKDEMDTEYGSYSKARKELGWEPKINLEEGLRRLITEVSNENNLQAVILAGGRGKRMQIMYPKTPKLLIPIKNKPFLDYLVDYLISNGFSGAVLSTGFLRSKIVKHIKEKKYNISIDISSEKSPLGTGGALSSIKHLLKNDFFLFFGDVYTKVDLNRMFEFHKKKKAFVTAVIHQSEHPESSNLVEFDSESRITKILMKPHGRSGKNLYNLAALYLVDKGVKKYLSSKFPYDFERDVLAKLLSENIPVYGYNTSELIMDFGTPKQLKKLEEKLLRK